MSDELEAQLRRHFANAAAPLASEQFVLATTARLAARRRWLPNARSLTELAATVVGGLAAGLSVLRLKHTRFMVLGAAAVSLWVSLI
jgi:hypothetical protein